MGGGGRGGRLPGKRTHRGVGEAAAVRRDDSAPAAREQLAAVRHPGAAGHLGNEAERVNAPRPPTQEVLTPRHRAVTPEAHPQSLIFPPFFS